MGAYLFALEITPMHTDHVYTTGLPLHCTVLNWFRTNTSESEVLEKAIEIVETTPPIHLVGSTPAMFGPSNRPQNIAVNLIQPNLTFRQLHHRLLAAMESLGVEHTEPTYTGNGFRAHVTKQGDQQLGIGSQHLSLATYFIEAVDPDKITKKRVVMRLSHKLPRAPRI